MRIVHSAIVTPRLCGLYETTRDLVAAERKLGVDARIFNPLPEGDPKLKHQPKGPEDRGVPLCGPDWAAAADLVVSHSGHDGTVLSDTKQPVIHVAHGRPVSTFIGQRKGEAPVYSYALNRRRDPRYRACVTFWPEHEPYHRTLWAPKPVHVVPPPCDTSFWSPGETRYDFAGRKAAYNVVLADPWSRDDVSPILAVHAFALFRAMVPEARLHVYGLDGNTRGLDAVKAMLGDGLGVIQGWASDLRTVYRAADMLVTPHRIWTRALRESMACGVQTVSGRDANPEDLEAFAYAMAKRRDEPMPARRMAEAMFDPEASARKFLGYCEAALKEAA
jgi:glycosyltransferase involved in cell wall biosynthesis